MGQCPQGFFFFFFWGGVSFAGAGGSSISQLPVRCLFWGEVEPRISVSLWGATLPPHRNLYVGYGYCAAHLIAFARISGQWSREKDGWHVVRRPKSRRWGSLFVESSKVAEG